MPTSTDKEADRLMKLLDVGLDALRQGDGDGTLMALEEALKTAKAMPQKPNIIHLSFQPQRTTK